MRSIYEKITIVLILGFIAQVVLILLFFNQVAVKNIVSVINEQENKRQIIMRDVVTAMQNATNQGERVDKVLMQYSKEQKVAFTLKNIDGDTLFTTGVNTSSTSVKAQEFIKSNGRLAYILEGYFPARISLDPSFKEGRVRVVSIVVILVIAVITLIIIYKALAEPLKKLSNAVKNINYGNTVIKIPYHGDDELGLLCRNFEDMGMRLKKSEEAQQELLQAISHDVKTPLTSILGYSKRLLDGKVNEERTSEYYETINRKANDLKFLLEELDDYTNVNFDSKYDKKVIGCKDYLNEIVLELKKEISENGGTLEINYEALKNIHINIDERKIKRVFINIVENSFKYAGEQCHIIISALEKNKHVLFEVSDNGIGVPEEQLSRIFDRFFRVESSRCREKGGTGLGLSICKEIIESHQGGIGAYNNTEKGLCIWFTLPIYEK